MLIAPWWFVYFCFAAALEFQEHSRGGASIITNIMDLYSLHPTICPQRPSTIEIFICFDFGNCLGRHITRVLACEKLRGGAWPSKAPFLSLAWEAKQPFETVVRQTSTPCVRAPVLNEQLFWEQCFYSWLLGFQGSSQALILEQGNVPTSPNVPQLTLRSVLDGMIGGVSSGVVGRCWLSLQATPEQT